MLQTYDINPITQKLIDNSTPDSVFTSTRKTLVEFALKNVTASPVVVTGWIVPDAGSANDATEFFKLEIPADSPYLHPRPVMVPADGDLMFQAASASAVNISGIATELETVA